MGQDLNVVVVAYAIKVEAGIPWECSVLESGLSVNEYRSHAVIGQLALPFKNEATHKEGQRDAPQTCISIVSYCVWHISCLPTPILKLC